MIIFLIFLASGCNLPMKNLTIYPTVDELFIMPLQQLFNGNNLVYSCRLDCPKNATLLNAMNLIGQYPQNFITTSISSNNTHFVTLSNESAILHLFDYNSNTLNSIPPAFIDSALQCFNSLFTTKQQIILDCYNNGQNILQFYDLNQSTLIIMQTFYNQSAPIKTKLLNFIQNEEVYILYAQFYDQYEILTLFKYGDNQLVNLTTWQQGLIDFDVSQDFLYIIDKIIIYQIILNQRTQFQISFAYRALNTFQMQVIKVKKFYFSSAQCDFLCIVSLDGATPLMVFQAWNESIIQFSHGYNPALDLKSNPYIQVQFSEQFIICQFNNNMTINQIGIPYFGVDYPFFYTTKQSSPIKYSYLEGENNYLFQFSDQIEIYSLQIPQLQINTSDSKLRKFDIYVSSSNFFDVSCSLQIIPFILNKNDTNIYVTYTNLNIFYNVMQNMPFIYQLSALSGPLIKAIGIIQNSTLGNFNDITFQQQDVRFNQLFQITNLFYFHNTVLNEKYKNRKLLLKEILFVGATENELFFYACDQDFSCKYLYNDENLEIINRIQITFRYEATIVVGVNQGNKVLIYNIELFENNTMQINKVSFLFSPYKSFLLTYDNIIVLLNDEIYIQSLIDSTNCSINQQTISQAFQTEKQFKPINIEMNVPELSSILYINNGDSVIIVAIDNTISITPFSIIQINQPINQLNIINFQLIVSYFYQYQICFQIWNVQNLINPFFVKTLPSLNMYTGWNIISDNLFLYIMSPNYQIVALNPQQTYHSSLYYEFEFQGNYFSCISIGAFSIISFNNSIYKLNGIINQNFVPQSSIDNANGYVTQTYFFFNATNSFQKSNSTQIEVLNIFNNLTQIYFKNDLEQEFNHNQNYKINLTANKNISSSGQILGYSYQNNENFCTLYNYIEPSNKSSNNYSFSDQTQLLMLNQTLTIQEGSNILILNISNYEILNNKSNQIYSKNFSECSKTTIYNSSIATQVCKGGQDYNFTFFLSQFNFSCVLNNCSFTQVTDTRIPVQFTQIIKMTPINQYNHMILAQQFKLNKQLYVLHMNSTSQFSVIKVRSLRIPCTDGIKDFILLELTEIPNFYAILFLCQNQLLYRLGQINQENQFIISKGDLNQTLITAEKLIQLGDSELFQILYLSQRYFSFLLLLTTSNAVNVMFTASYDFTKNADILNVTLFLQQIIQTIPPYGNYSLVQANVVEGLVFTVFQSDYEKIYAIYDWVQIENNITTPLVMKGGLKIYDLQLTSLAFNISSSQVGGQIYDLNKTNLVVYVIQGNAYLDCTLEYHKNKSLTLIASNSFSQGELNIQFIYIQQKNWVIGLVVFVVSIFIIVIIIYWYKTKNIEKKESLLEEEEELGLEL